MADNERMTTGAEINTNPVNEVDKQNASPGNDPVKTNTVNDSESGDNTISDNGVNGDGKEKTSGYGVNGNLIPGSMRSQSELRENGAKGGKISGENRRQRKAAKEIAQAILSATMREDQIDDVLDGAKSLLGDDKSAYAVLIAKMVQEGLAGNVNAFTAVRDTAGDKPTDKQEVTASVTAGDLALMEKMRARLGLDKRENVKTE